MKEDFNLGKALIAVLVILLLGTAYYEYFGNRNSEENHHDEHHKYNSDKVELLTKDAATIEMFGCIIQTNGETLSEDDVKELFFLANVFTMREMIKYTAEEVMLNRKASDITDAVNDSLRMRNENIIWFPHYTASIQYFDELKDRSMENSPRVGGSCHKSDTDPYPCGYMPFLPVIPIH